jgi:hypothetical protein
MSQWYNHYRFSIYSTAEVFNTVHVLYFLQEYMKNSMIPVELVDRNFMTDYNKLRHLVIIDKQGKPETNGNFSRLKGIIETGSVHSDIERGFPIADISHSKNFISLLYYFGLLTIKEIDDENTPVLIIPNEMVRRLYYDYIVSIYEETSDLPVNRDVYKEYVKGMAYRGNWEEAILFISKQMENSLGLRDLMAGEKAHQVFWNVYLGLSKLYRVYSEKELNQGYCDLVMSPALEQNPTIKFSYLIELKYIKPSDYSDKDVPEAKILQLQEEAEKQLNRYSKDEKFKQSIGQTVLKKIVLIFSGNRLLHKEV